MSRAIEWILLGAGSGVAIILGVRRHLLAASVATAAVLLIEALTGPVPHGLMIAAAAGLVLPPAVTRLTGSISGKSRAARRERVLRGATGALAAAADRPAVDHAIRAAVAGLMPPQSVQSLALAPGDRAPAGPDGRDRDRRSWWLDEAGAKSTLVCPLRLTPTATAHPGGALVVTGGREALTVARDALEVLAGQAALALDRIATAEAAARRDSDRHLRTVIGASTDLVLVIDDDQRIRYASPGVHDLLGGGGLSPLATLADLVDPDDRGQVRRAFASSGDGSLFCALRRADDSQVLVEATYRDLREDRLVRGFVVTMRKVTATQDHVGCLPHLANVGELPGWVNRRSAQHKFRY